MRRKIIGLGLYCAFWAVGLQSQDRDPGTSNTTTEDRVEGSGWWPTKGNLPKSSFVGNETCGRCHADKVRSQAATPMANAGYRAKDSDILRKRNPLVFSNGPYTYRIAGAVSSPSYSVSDGEQVAATQLLWAFGEGQVGQTFLYQQNEKWYESHVSFFSTPEKLDITTGHSHSTPESVEKAMGRVMSAQEAQRCFGCHTTASTVTRNFEPQNAVPGVTCEACHGPGATHLAKLTSTAPQTPGTGIVNPAHMSPVDSVDFCGACHRTWWDIALSGVKNRGIEVVRFEPYRLEESRCWGKAGDSRITCIACHDPHQPLERASSAYDQKCLACHLSQGDKMQKSKPGAACPKSNDHCTSCHMPKYAVPGAYATFTDHWIRIVRDREPFPE
jgi:hypothetical protein